MVDRSPARAGRSRKEVCEGLARRAFVFVSRRRKNFSEKYNRSAMENAHQLQCKALRRLEKIRRRKNNGEQWKKQCAERWKRSGIRARADASPGHLDTAHKQSPAALRRRAHASETRISAIAHSSAGCTLKRAPVIPECSHEACDTRSYATGLCLCRRALASAVRKLTFSPA